MLPLVALVALGCSGAQPKQSGDDYNFDQTPSGEAASEPSGVEGPSEDQGGLNEDQKKQMEIALRRGGDKAASCPEVVPNSPTGEGEVQVVFDGQKGRVVDVKMGPPFAGTPAEACIKRAFVGEIVLPFEGGPLNVPYTVKLPAKGASAEKKKSP